MGENLIKDKHSGGVARNFVVEKIVALVNEHYFWPQIYIRVSRSMSKVAEFIKLQKGVVKIPNFINL
jgi:hypothetical protein